MPSHEGPPEPVDPFQAETGLTPEQRTLRARHAAHTKWSKHDPVAGTAKARERFLDRFEDEVDPDRELPEAERLRRAESARKAYFTELAYKSSRSRSAKKAAAESEAVQDVAS